MAIARALVVDIALNQARISRDVNKVKKSFQGLENNVKKIGLAVVKVTAVFLGLRKAWDLANQAAKFDQAEQAFANLAASYDGNSQKIIKSLKEMSGQTISTANLIESAGTALLLGIPVDKLTGMMEIARAASRITGQSIQQAFNDIAKGMGRQSKLILDNLGILVSVDKANKAYAKQMGIVGRALSDAEKKQAFMNATLKAGEAIVKRINVTNLTAAEAMQKFSAAWENAKIVIGKLIISITALTSAVLNFAIVGLATVIQKIAEFILWFSKLHENIPLVGVAFESLSKKIESFIHDLEDTRKAGTSMAASSIAVSDAIWEKKRAMDGATESGKLMREEEEKQAALNKQLIQDEKDKQALEKLVTSTEQLEKELVGPVSNVEAIMADNEMRLELLAQYQNERMEMIRLTSESELEIVQRQADLEEEIAEKKHQLQVSFAAQSAGQIAIELEKLFIITGEKNKKIFKLMKAFQIAQTLINTYRAAVEVLPNYVAFGSIILTGLAQVAKIKSTQPGGGGGGSSGGGGVAISGGAVDQPTPITEGALPSQNITINVQNGTGDQAYWQELIEEVIVPGINDAQDRNINLTLRTV